MHQSVKYVLLHLFQLMSASQSIPFPCATEADCPKDVNSTCVTPSDDGQGLCFPSCTLTSDDRLCRLGQACEILPQISTMQLGYCPDPASCGGLLGAPCADDRNPVCMDDPMDDCNPENDGADCEGICVARLIPETSTTTTSVILRATGIPNHQSCGGWKGKKCPIGYICEDDLGTVCNLPKGRTKCSKTCVKERLCDSRGLPQCRRGEKCVHIHSCSGSVDCPGVCRRKEASASGQTQH